MPAKDNYLEESKKVLVLIEEIQRIASNDENCLEKLCPGATTQEQFHTFLACIVLDLMDISFWIAAADGKVSQSEIEGLQAFLFEVSDAVENPPAQRLLIREYMQVLLSSFRSRGIQWSQLQLRLPSSGLGDFGRLLARAYVHYGFYVALLDGRFHRYEAKSIEGLLENLKPYLKVDFVKEKKDQIKSLGAREGSKAIDDFTQELKRMLQV